MPPFTTTSVLEALEPRLAPAGIVAVAVKNGVLSLTGDAEFNNVQITDLGNGTWRIHDSNEGYEDPINDPTTFRLNGAAVATSEVIVTGISKVKNLTANLKGGDDILFLQDLTLPGSITIKDSVGGDAFKVFGSTIGGTVKVDFSGGQNTDAFHTANSSFGGALTVKTGAGNDEVAFNAGSYRSITADLGDGSNIFGFFDENEGAQITVLGNVAVSAKGTLGNDNLVSIDASETTIIGNFKINFINAGGSFGTHGTVSSGTLTVTGDLSFQAGVSETGQSFGLAHNIIVGGKVDVKFGNGFSQFSDGTEHFSASSLSITFGNSSNFGMLGGINTHIAGDTTVRMNGTGEFTLLEQVRIGGKFTYLGSKGDDTLTLEGNLNIGGLLEMKAGNGRNTLNTSEDLRSLTLGAFKYTGGNAHDSVSLSYADLTILGDVNINLGAVPYAGEFEKDVDIGYGADVTIHGDVTTSQGSLWIRGEQVRILGHVSHTSLKIGAMLTVEGNDVIIGSISVKGSAGEDELTLGRHDSANQKLLVLGDVTANLGKLSSGVILYDTTVLGSVAITAATNEPPEGGGPELFLFADSLFAGSVSVKATGTANTTLRIHNSTFSSAVTLDTGRGNDTVHLDTPLPTSGNLEARNTFHGPVRILLGAGDDTLNLGPDSSQAHYGNNFLGTFFADGGPGTNTAPGLDSPNNEFATAPELKNFTP